MNRRISVYMKHTNVIADVRLWFKMATIRFTISRYARENDQKIGFMFHGHYRIKNSMII